MRGGLVIFLIAAVAAVRIQAETKPEGGPYTEIVRSVEWTFSVSDGKSQILGADALRGCVALPSQLGGHDVVSIASSAFSGCEQLTAAIIPEGVTNIGARVFSSCSALQAVSFPETLRIIGESCFLNCLSLKSVTIRPGLETLGSSAFYGCSSMTSATFPRTLAKLGTYCFYWCSSLSFIEFQGPPPSQFSEKIVNDRTIGIRYSSEFAAKWQAALARLRFSNTSVCSPPQEDGGPYWESADGLIWTYTVCNGQSSVGVDGTTGALSSSASGGVVIPTYLGRHAVTNVATGAFKNQSGITSVTIPLYVESIGETPFAGCQQLARVDFEGLPPRGWVQAILAQSLECRYNVAYEEEWIAAIERDYPEYSEHTHTFTPYDPTGAPLETTVVFSAEGGSVSKKSCSYSGETYGVLPEASRAGFTFAGWYASVDGQTRVTAFSSVDTAAKVLYARWVESDEALYSQCKAWAYDVNFAANGGTGTMVSQRFLRDQTRPLTGQAFARTGYSFKGWSRTSEGEVVYQDGEAVSNVTAEVSPLAAVSEASAGTVQFVTGRGSVSLDEIECADETYGALPEATCEGYAFAGWYTSPQGEGRRVTAFSSVDPSETTLYARWAEQETTLHAQWQANAYAVGFDANGGSGTMEDQPFVYDEAQPLDAARFTKSGYKFVGWATNELGAVVYGDGETVSNLTAEAGATVTLFARWAVLIDITEDEIWDWVVYDLAPQYAREGESNRAYLRRFEATYGDDYAKSFFKETGKTAADGTPLCVWQDYVAGTDPLDKTSNFMALLEFDESGRPSVDFSPKFADAEKAALRRYRIWAKKDLRDATWVEIPSGSEPDYNFFKVTVEMQ